MCFLLSFNNMKYYNNYDFKNILKTQEAINVLFNITAKRAKYYFKVSERKKKH